MRQMALIAGLIVTPLSADDPAPAGIRVGLPAADVQHQLGAPSALFGKSSTAAILNSGCTKIPKIFGSRSAGIRGKYPSLPA